MSIVITRPDVSDLIFHVYNRPIHPELIDKHDEIFLVEDDFTCAVRLHDAGHLIEFQHGDTLVTEIMSSRNHPLPKHGLELKHYVSGSRDSELSFDHVLAYQSSFQLERLDSEIFLNFHQELQFDFRKACLAREYPGLGRFSPGPISLVRTETTLESFLIHTYHTYPENRAVVKTQTLIEFSND